MKIAILLSTYNGTPFLMQQLDSLLAQSHSSYEVFVRDDGSQDATVQILKGYNVKLLPSTVNLGSKESFATLLNYALINSDANYFMFCDQDDVWYNDKVENTLLKMEQMEARFGDIPLLVHTDLEVVDESLKTIAHSMWDYDFTLPSKNALNRLLLQNTITGCTVMINRNLAEMCTKIPKDAIMHDWWIGLVAAQFGRISYISYPTIKYRQHGKNVYGAKGFKVNVFKHVVGTLLGTVYSRSDRYINHLSLNITQANAFLNAYEKELDAKTINMLRSFVDLPNKSYVSRVYVLLRYGLLKQGFLRNLSMLLKI